MNTLDQAFVKAYQKQSLVPPPHAAMPAGRHAFQAGDGPLGGGWFRSPEPAAPPPKVADPLRPAFEVDRFAWPDEVGALRAAADQQLGALAEELAAAGRGGQKVLLVTGCRRAEGRTTVLLALGRHLAAAGLKVALVDGHFRRPQLAERLGVLVQAGWEDVLAGEIPLAEALVESLEDRLTLLPLSKPLAASAALAASRRVPPSLQVLAQQYDLVGIDGGPPDEGLAGMNLAAFGQSSVDRALVVRDTRSTSPDEVLALGRRLVDAGIGSWDLAENFMRV